MKTVIQRVKSASVGVSGKKISEIGKGFLILLGVEKSDTRADLEALVKKISKLRIFSDAAGRMNLALGDVGGSILLVSQFTLCANARHGNRPAFVDAMDGGEARLIYLDFGAELEKSGIPVAYGQFGADMEVSLVNDGPVTIILESRGGVVC